MSSKSDGFYEGDRVIVDRHAHGKIGRVMALAEGYAMVRYRGCFPFVVSVSDLIRVADIS